MKKIQEDPKTTPDNKNIFITATDSTSGNDFFINSDERRKIAEIYKQFELLNSAADQIDQHFVKTLSNHEQDFIKAYKSQMDKVNKELKFLKNRQTE